MSGGGGSNVKADKVTPSKIDISDAVATILQSAEILVPALKSAGIDLTGTFGQSNSLLAGYGQVMNNATSQMQSLLGMTPVDLEGKQLQQQVQSIRSNFLGSDMSSDPQLRALFSEVDSNLADANGITDPTKRQQAYDSTMKSFQGLVDGLTASTPAKPGTTIVSDIDKLKSESLISIAQANMIAQKYGDASLAFTATPKSLGGLNNRNGGAMSGANQMGMLTGGNLTAALTGGLAGSFAPPEGLSRNGGMSATKFIEWFKTQKAYTGGSSSSNTAGTPGKEPGQNNFQLAQQVENMMQNFKYQYNVEGPQKLSGADISKQIQESPEFLASYDTGLKAINRTAAATGMLASGNTLREAANFSTQLAGTVYGDLYNRMAGLQTQTAPLANQAASNLNQTGQATYGQAIAPQQARSSAMLGTGELKGNTALAQANLNQQAAIANQQAKLQADSINAQIKAQNSGGFGSALGQIGGTLLGAFI